MNKKRKYRLKTRRKMKLLENSGEVTSGNCPSCGGEIFFFYRFDADCCLRCDEWLEEKCGDPNCSYCRGRPDSPSEALFNESPKNTSAKGFRRDNYFHKESGRYKKIRKLEDLRKYQKSSRR